MLLDVTPASSCVKRYAGRLATREPCRPRRRHHRHPVTELAPGQRADGASAVGCAQTVAPLSMKIESTAGPSRTGGARRYRRSPPLYPCSRHPRGHNTPTPGPQHANPDNPIATPADRPTPHLQQVANPKCHNPIPHRIRTHTPSRMSACGWIRSRAEVRFREASQKHERREGAPSNRSKSRGRSSREGHRSPTTRSSN